MRRPKIIVGDGLTDDIHQVGIISDINIGAKKALYIKRAHWKIENSPNNLIINMEMVIDI